MPPQSVPATPNAPRILLTGATGQVGAELLHTLASLGEVVAPARETLDLANPASIRETLRAVQPRWIVNAAAYTAVDKAESEPDLAHTINAGAVQVIAEEALALGAAVIHFSTDYVFDGSGTRPWMESDPTCPLSIYGQTKLAGEQALAASGAPYLIFRTSWVYGARGKNFLRTILTLARERKTLRIVSDQHGAPTWSRDLARMTAHVIRQCESAAVDASLAEAISPRCDIYHAAGAGETTWYGFAAEALRLQRERHLNQPLAALEAISSAEYPVPAQRPLNSRLDCGRLARSFGWTMMPWQDSLREVLSEL